MRDERTKNKHVTSSPPKTTTVRKELPADVKRALDKVEQEVKKEKQR